MLVVGEAANFAAYAYAPAVLVTPLGAISIIMSALLADVVLGEKLHRCGMLGCLSCTVGSAILVSASPEERLVQSVDEVWAMATQPLFVAYTICVIVAVLVLSLWLSPYYGETQVLVYVAICSLMGSLSVVSCKALGIALKLTLKGHSQLQKQETYFFATFVVVCIASQMNYLNKALDTFNTTMVSSVYYVLFTVATVTASMIMYKDWENQTANSISFQLLGFSLIVSGVYILNATRDAAPGFVAGLRTVFGSFAPEEWLESIQSRSLFGLVLLAKIENDELRPLGAHEGGNT
mmetsp:Transcript_16788/g.27838  ORF Transcript_16788/g.27838 Transcript_16788/m.27838 type:complete len:293 (-) Transcript_16788:533-1411(-)